MGQERVVKRVVKRGVLQQSIHEIWMPSPGLPHPCGLFLDHSECPFLAQDLHARRYSVQLHSAPDAKNGLWHPEPGHWTGGGPGIADARWNEISLPAGIHVCFLEFWTNTRTTHTHIVKVTIGRTFLPVGVKVRYVLIFLSCVY